jgi:hypothetical protein
MRQAMRTSAALFLLLAPGCAAWFSPFRIPEQSPPDLKFLSRSDLGIPGRPLPLDVVFTIHPQIRLEAPAPWGRRDDRSGLDRSSAFRSLTLNVLTEVFASAVEEAPGSHERLEDLRRSLGRSEELPPLNAKALVLVDFRPSPAEPSGLAAQLSVKVYDISYQGYDRMTLFNPRLLIFEDFAEVAPAEDAAKFPGTIFLAWKEVLWRMRSSHRFQKYLALERESLDDSTEAGAVLLGIVPQEHIPRTPDLACSRWIEEEFLFPRPAQVTEAEAPLPPAPAPAEGTAAPSPLWSDEAGAAERGPPAAADLDRIGPPPIEGPDPSAAPAGARWGPTIRPGEGR